ncbi:MAG: SBBP repeat-containing protein [Bacteriovoracaceae bacterium]|nr:SBBP repeat-containing protein [Bacteriovoracaceae bacterium]
MKLITVLITFILFVSCNDILLKNKINSKSNMSSWFTHIGSEHEASFSLSTSGADQCIGSTIDSEGNIICVGATTGNLKETFGGMQDAFIAKFNSLGKLLWLTHLGQESATSLGLTDITRMEFCNSVATDSSGNIYCGGSTWGALSEPNGDFDIMLIKLNKDGVIQWVKNFGTTSATAAGVDTSGVDICSFIALDSSNNIICIGETDSNLADTALNRDIFYIKFDNDGNYISSTQLGSSYAGANSLNLNSHEACTGGFLDSSDNVYCFGYTQSDMEEAKTSLYDPFVVKFNSSGSVTLLNHIGTSDYGFANTASDRCTDGVVASDGSIYCVGNTTSSGLNESIAGTSDTVIWKLNASGALLWVKQFGQVTTDVLNTAFDQGLYITLDQNENPIITGFTSGADLFDINAGGEDFFLARLSKTNGNILKSRQYGTSYQTLFNDLSLNESPTSIMYANGNLYLTLRSTSNFVEINSTSAHDIVTAKIIDF